MTVPQALPAICMEIKMQKLELKEERCLIIWRIMFPVEHQNRGYGTQAVKEIIRMAKESGNHDFSLLDCAPNNPIARHVYEKLGFQPTGILHNEEIEFKLMLKMLEKSGYGEGDFL